MAGAIALASCRKTGGLPGRPDEPSPEGPTSSAPTPAAGSLSREALLTAFADCTVSELGQFVQRARALEEAAQSYSSAPTDESRIQARVAWEAAIDQWQHLEMFQFGPAAMSGQPGGQDLRTQVYAWPQVNRCYIEQILVTRTYESDLAAQFANARGMGALDYLLFYEGTANACPTGNSINASGSWAALVADGIDGARAGYGFAAASDVRARAEALHSAWDKASGNFWSELARAGKGSTVYASAQAGLNAVSDALFYLDSETKDMKLAAPLGMEGTCLAGTCPELVESPFSGHSKVNIENNLLGFRKLFSGCDDPSALGFDDLLADIGQGALANDMAARLEAALSATRAIEEPTIAEALEADVESVRVLHAAVKAVTDLLKTDFVTVLDLELPVGAEGDND